MLFEGVETRTPEVSEGSQPVVDFSQRFWPDPVQATLGLDSRFDHARISEHLEVLGNGRLAYPQAVDQVTHGPFPSSQEIQDPAAGWFGQHVEGRHDRKYTQQRI